MPLSERWFVYEWSDTAGEPNIIAWCETRRDAEREFKNSVENARKDGDRWKGTEYALCHVEKEEEI